MSDEIKKVATRQSYGEALAELGDQYPDLVVLDADLANATKTGIFQKKFPDRHIDCGIAEADMTGIAAGLATCGKIPFISSFAMFASGRNFEQVRNSIGYPHLNVKIGATHAGISVGEDGATVGDFIPDTVCAAPSGAAHRALLHDWLMAVLDTLTEREREVLDYRFGLAGRSGVDGPKVRSAEKTGNPLRNARRRSL